MDLWSDDTSATVRLWSFSDDALLETGPEPGSLTVTSRWGELAVDGAEAVVTESLRRMGFGPVNLRNTVPRRSASGAGLDGGSLERAAVEALERVLDRLCGVVVHSLGLCDGQGPQLSVVPLHVEPHFRPAPVDPDRRLRLSRFATMRLQDRDLLLEVPGSAFHVLLHRPLAAALGAALATPAVVADLADHAHVPLPVTAELMSFLVAAGVVLVAAGDGSFAEDSDPALRNWVPHELQFHGHSRNRLTNRSHDAGAVGLDATTEPVTRPVPPGERFTLFRPDIGALAATDPTLTTLLETDHVCPRIEVDCQLTAEQVGELLFRSCRIRSLGPVHPPLAPRGVTTPASQRPYANTACLYELELYLTLNRCAGLPRGIYHYEPLDHVLTRIDGDSHHVDTMLDVGRTGAGSLQQPAALLTTTVRMGRLSWLLSGASYAVALKHCGALQETVYLVARAMGMAAHAVPVDAIDVVDPLLRLNGPAEVGIGECILEPVSPT